MALHRIVPKMELTFNGCLDDVLPGGISAETTASGWRPALVRLPHITPTPRSENFELDRYLPFHLARDLTLTEKMNSFGLVKLLPEDEEYVRDRLKCYNVLTMTVFLLSGDAVLFDFRSITHLPYSKPTKKIFTIWR